MFKLIFGFVMITGIIVVGAYVLPAPSFAQNQGQQHACLGAGGHWVNNECVSSDVDGNPGSATDPVAIINSIANVLLILIGAIAVLMLIIGGIRYVVSAGNANALEGAKNTILYAIIGIVVAFLSYAAVNTVISRLT